MKAHMCHHISLEYTRCGLLIEDVDGTHILSREYGSSITTCKSCLRLYDLDMANSAKDSGDSARDSGDSARDSGDSARDSGDSARDSNDRAKDPNGGDDK